MGQLNLVHVRDKCQAFVNRVMSLCRSIPQEAGNFSTS